MFGDGVVLAQRPRRTVAGLVLQPPPMSAAPACLHLPTYDTKFVPDAPAEPCTLRKEPTVS